MGKYTFKILTQGVVKIYGEITGLCSLLIFGDRPLPTDLIDLFSKQGIFYQSGFSGSTTSVSSLFSYRNRKVHNAIWELKFKNNRKIADIFGMLLSDYLTEELSNQYYLEYFDDPILLIVPSHNNTLRKRGYNPVDLIVRSALTYGLESHVTYLPDLVRKTTYAQPQSRIAKRADRLKNPRDCFTVKKPTDISGRNIILVDDVYTTGATMNEVVRILRTSGADKIMCITIAH